MKKLFCIFSTALALAVVLSAPALAEGIGITSRDPPGEAVCTEVFEETYLPDPDCLPDSEEIFAAYVQREFERELYGEVSTFGTAAGNRLSGLEKAVYDDLKVQLTQVADGGSSSTALAVTADLSSLTWTKEQLGVSTIVSGGSLTSEAQAAVAEKFSQALDTKALLSCLLADCPYELYWFDKTTGIQTGYSMSGNSTKISITGVTVSFSVASAYGSGYTADIAKTGATKSAIVNAKAIVTANAGKTDREKLDAYRSKICELVSYNHSTAGAAYGDPWQLIYVFDGNSSTNVVCEGYAKAFQYLCDLSTFSGDVVCYTVSGQMSGGTGSGGHMWNVVRLEGRNLLVDVTNCDTGAIGAPDKLFLTAVAGTDSGRTHTFPINSINVVFTYDESQKDLFCDGYLALTPTGVSSPGAVQLRFTAYDTGTPALLKLYQGGVVKYSKVCSATGSGGLAANVIQFTDVAAGTYDLVISKSGCLNCTVQNVVIPAEGLDLTSHSNPAVSNIQLLCGDVNGDGKINESDVSVIRYSSNINKQIAEAANKLTDVNGDGKVNESDVSVVRYSTHINKSDTNCFYNF